MLEEIDYLERRAAEELGRAQQSPARRVARPHYEMATRYRRRADELRRSLHRDVAQPMAARSSHG